MHSRRSRWLFIALALITNLGGGPMAWAHLAGSGRCHGATPAVAPMPADCAEHRNQHDPAPPAHPLPCCDGGACACAAPPAPVAMTLAAPADLRHETRLAPLVARVLAADPLDDPLRPPIH